MLRWRLILGFLLLLLFVGLCWLDAHAARPTTWLLPVALLITLAASEEILTLLTARGYAPSALVVYLGNFLIVASSAAPIFVPGVENSALARLAWPAGALALAVAAALVVEIRRYERPGQVMVNLSMTVFSLAYVGFLFSFVVQLRALAPQHAGLVALIALLAVVKMGDIGAYTVGRLIGRHKLAPVLSPGKTVEGALGAIAFSCLAAAIVALSLMPRLITSSPGRPWWGWLIFAVVVSIAGLLGDLAESLIKRDLGSKDSSTWLPGFGGVLDIIDSILVAAPVAYLCWVGGLVGP